MNSVIVMMTFNIVYTAAVVCWLVAVGNKLALLWGEAQKKIANCYPKVT